MKVKFRASKKQSIPNNTSSFILLRVGDTPQVLLGLDSIETLEEVLEVNLYENATVSADGTPVTPLNLNRNLDFVAQTLMFSEPTPVTNGDLIKTTAVAVSKPRTPSDDVALKNNTDYLIEIVNTGAGASTVYSNIVLEEVQ